MKTYKIVLADLNSPGEPWDKEYDLPDNLPTEVIYKVGQGHAFMADYSAQDTNTTYWEKRGEEWFEI
jgi:hypothetical protein